MKNYWLNQKSYQIAFLKEGEWYHLFGFGSDFQNALRHYNQLYIWPIRLIVHQRSNYPIQLIVCQKLYHVDEGKVLMEKESHC